MARLGERAISALGMVLVAPIAALIALAIVVDDPGPVLIRRCGIGADGRRFAMYRFRTDPVSHRRPDEVAPRRFNKRSMTPIGALLWATRLDEIPLLVNLWRGDLSLVDHDRHLVRVVK